jgi:sulfatase maturation enzyme AslB (radical SAM superfamily)
VLKYNDIKQQDYEAIAGPDWPSFADFQSNRNILPFVYAEIDSMLGHQPEFDNTAFCVLPFYGMEYPESTPCCLLPKVHDIEKIKLDMLAGIRPSACNKCWKLEDQGLTSDRVIKNQTLDAYFNKDLWTLYDLAKQNKNSTVHYKFDAGNTCNGTCITCGSKFSTAWANLEKKNNLRSSKSWQITPEQADSWIDYSTAKTIAFRGGEPLLNETNFYILEQLLKHNNSSCFIGFTTNGSIKLSTYQKELLSKFQNVNFCFSIDGVGPVFEYLRYPLQWDRVQQNIDYCRTNNIEVSASYTISNLNIAYHTETIAWFDDNKIPFIHNPVYDPTWFRPDALPKDVKLQLGIDTHTPKDDVDYEIFKQKIAEQDQWKGIKMQDYLPKLTKLIG